MRRTLSSTLATFFAVALLAPFAWAQGGPPAQMQQMPEPDIEASDVSDQELDAAADVMLDMQSLRQKYAPQMQGVESRQEAMQIRQQMMQEAQQVVESNEEIEAEHFQQIQLLARTDTTFRQRLVDRVKAKSETMGGMQPQQGQDGDDS